MFNIINIIIIIATIFNLIMYLKIKKADKNTIELEKTNIKLLEEMQKQITYEVFFDIKVDPHAELKNYLISDGWKFKQTNNEPCIPNDRAIWHTFTKNGHKVIDFFCNQFDSIKFEHANYYHGRNDLKFNLSTHMSLETKVKLINTYMEIV